MEADYTCHDVQLVFDTNILVDAMTARGHFYQSAVEVLEMVRNGAVEGWYAPHTVTTAYYLLERTLRQDAETHKQAVEMAKSLLRETLSFLKPLPLVGDELLTLNSSAGDDLEDLLIIRLATDYLPNPLFVTRDKWFLTMGAENGAHPKEIVANGLAAYARKKGGLSFIDLVTQQRAIRPQLEKNIHTVLQHGKYILGPEVRELQEKLADFVGVRHCVGVSSGTDALLMCLMARGIGPGDAVFTTPFTFIATAEVISLLGATPVFVDIDPRTFNIDPDQLKKAIAALSAQDQRLYPLPANHQELTAKAIMPVDIFGLPVDHDPIMTLAKEHDLFVLEDAAQGLGGIYKGRPAGSLGQAAATSFFPAKPIGCYGDGGAVLTNDDELAEQVRSIRVHGKGIHKYDNVRIGLNARLHTLQAAILLPKLDIFPQEIKQRQKVAQQYSAALSELNHLTVPSVPDGLQSVWAQYSLLSKDRQQIQKSLKDKSIPTAVYYETPLHLQTAYKALAYSQGDMPVAEQVSQQIFSLPMHPYLGNDDMTSVVTALKETI